MATLANPFPPSGAVVLHAVSAARGQSSPVEVARQPYRMADQRFGSFYVGWLPVARWASLGCDATRRQQSNANSAGIAKSPRQSFCVIQTAFHQNAGLVSVVFNIILGAVFDRPANQRQRPNELWVGGFHSSQSLVATSGVETFTS